MRTLSSALDQHAPLPVRRLARAAAAAVWLSVAWTGLPGAVPAAATAGTETGTGSGTGAVAEEHRAAVIVDTGTGVKSVCVRFREESITGVEALARAQVDPVFHGFAGKGAAVCALCGVGCPAGDSCLTCNPEGKFWSYSRAPAGTGGLRTSGVGASSTTVRDGDVEGWKFALGGAPPFATVEQVCGEAPAVPSATSAPSPAAAVTTTVAGVTSTSPVGTTMAGTATTRPASRVPAPAGVATTAAPAPTVATAAPAGPGPAPAGPGPGAAAAAGQEAATPPTGLAVSRTAAGRDEGSGGWPGLALFAALLVGLALWSGVARRSRRRTPGARS